MSSLSVSWPEDEVVTPLGAATEAVVEELHRDCSAQKCKTSFFIQKGHQVRSMLPQQLQPAQVFCLRSLPVSSGELRMEGASIASNYLSVRMCQSSK